MAGQVGEQLVDLGVITHVAVKDQSRAEICRELCDALLETFANVAESQFGTLLVTGPSNAISDGAIGQDARNQQFFSSQKTHIVLKMSAGI
jgi:hypothetical protein